MQRLRRVCGVHDRAPPHRALHSWHAGTALGIRVLCADREHGVHTGRRPWPCVCHLPDMRVETRLSWSSAGDMAAKRSAGDMAA